MTITPRAPASPAPAPPAPAPALPSASPARRSLLARLDGPADLRALPHHALGQLATEIRDFLVAKVCATGGHLGVNLGVVELTLALHRVFDSPRDVLLFDTGHQTYVHKLLTGRQAGFDRLRQPGGLSGYPARTESAHDWIESSHASTALSYADGLAKALGLRGETGRRVVAVIGDGALTGGLAWEGLNNLAASAHAGPVVIVLNDNGRSYAPTVGGLARHLGRLRGHGPDADTASPAPTAETLFEHLGFTYLGPVDGHDTRTVEAALRHARSLAGPVLVHCVTAKGKGYAPAEADEADRMHGIGILDPATGRPPAAVRSKESWTSVFAAEITALAARHPDLVAVTAAMLRPVGLHRFAEAFPGRVFDCGIAEQHALCSAAGLAMGGLHPVVCLYATFLNRAFDQLLMDVALHRLPVTLVLDRAGVTGPDGASHHGMWDTTLLSAVPGIRLAAPRDPATLRELLREAVAYADGPTALRFPKATAGPDIRALGAMDGIDILRRSPHRPLDVLLVGAGVMAGPCLEAAAALERDGHGVTVVDPRWTHPVHDALPDMAARHRLAVTVEDTLAEGGIGSALRAACADRHITTPVRVLGLPRAFLTHGERTDLLARAGLDAQGITHVVTQSLTPRAAP
ncbi:1-deoxy-D-xylulose-5-phosphate synthase [Streptomyces sp. NPDC007100]|uniref:1-deoxy-D-xylulose-5-phosphate synthase n=1 Tax=Streptomyces sp. NPDC007100 TaxID=3155602 RepID=UPI0033FD1FF6